MIESPEGLAKFESKSVCHFSLIIARGFIEPIQVTARPVAARSGYTWWSNRHRPARTLARAQVCAQRTRPWQDQSRLGVAQAREILARHDKCPPCTSLVPTHNGARPSSLGFIRVAAEWRSDASFNQRESATNRRPKLVTVVRGPSEVDVVPVTYVRIGSSRHQSPGNAIPCAHSQRDCLVLRHS